jgi:V/A-type H+/Na+-transporting ATPase subunit D
VARALSLTRLELKRQREALARFERFLPALKRKQQQLQLALQQLDGARRMLAARIAAAESALAAYGSVLGDVAGADLRALATPADVATVEENVAGVSVPGFDDVAFPPATYSLFASAPWADRTLEDLRHVARLGAELEVLTRRRALLARELTRVLQRVNLFEKVKIPRTGAAIRRIRIHLGDEMSAAVGRAKIAKSRAVAVAGAGEEAP